MTIHVLRRAQLIPAPLEEVFAFFQTPENLGLLTPPWLRFTILTPSPVTMGTGSVIDYTIGWGPFPMHWRTLIAGYTPPREFIDIQLKGPYSYWHHRHRFSRENGGTRIEDEVHYGLPLWFLGSIAHRILIQRQLMRIFDFRAAAIERIFNVMKEETASFEPTTGNEQSTGVR